LLQLGPKPCGCCACLQPNSYGVRRVQGNEVHDRFRIGSDEALAQDLPLVSTMRASLLVAGSGSLLPIARSYATMRIWFGSPLAPGWCRSRQQSPASPGVMPKAGSVRMETLGLDRGPVGNQERQPAGRLRPELRLRAGKAETNLPRAQLCRRSRIAPPPEATRQAVACWIHRARRTVQSDRPDPLPKPLLPSKDMP
jgi:hypothetical protein